MESFDPVAIAARIREALDVTGISMNVVERSVRERAASLKRKWGLSRGYLSRIADPKGYSKTMSVQMLALLAEELTVRGCWLIFGEGEMLESVEGEDSDPGRARLRRMWIFKKSDARVRAHLLSQEGAAFGAKVGDWVKALQAAEQRLRLGRKLGEIGPGAYFEAPAHEEHGQRRRARRS